MPLIPDHIIEKIESAISLVDIVRDHVAELKKQANGEWRGKSPFGEEKTPSFYVNESKGYYCFSTGKKGRGPAQFLVDVGAAPDWRRAMDQLAQRAGIDLSEGMDEAQAQRYARKKQSVEVLEWAASAFRQAAHQSEAFVEWLTGRGWSVQVSEHVCEAGEIGLAPDNPSFLRRLSGDSITAEQLEAAGLLREGEYGLYEPFANRIVFPIRDEAGRVVGFGGRVTATNKSKAKYINSSESDVYHKSALLYMLHAAQQPISQHGFAIITEGYTDTLAMHAAGFTNTVATCGTALTPQHAVKLIRSTQQVVLLRDGDKAGRKATRRDLDVLLPAGFDVQVVSLPDGIDPDEYLQKEGAAGMGSLLANAQPWPVWLAAQHGEERLRLDDMVKALRLLDDTLFRDLTIKQAAEVLGLDAERVAAQVNGQTQNEALEQALKSPRLTVEQYNALLTALEAKPSETIAARQDGYLDFVYRTTEGHVMTQGGEQIIRSSGQQTPVDAPFLPFDIESFTGRRLYVVQDEATAHILTELGYPAIGLSQPTAFNTGKRSARLHRQMQRLLKELPIREVVYVLPGKGFTLPPANGGEPYREVDPTKYAREAVDHMRVFASCFSSENIGAYVLVPAANTPELGQSRWLERVMLRKGAAFANELSKAQAGSDSELALWQVNYATEETLREIVHAGSAQAFLDFHGVSKLGAQFIFTLNGQGQGLYKVDPAEHRAEEVKDEDEDKPVWRSRNRIWSRGRAGTAKKISNFGIRFKLKITSQTNGEAKGLYEITHYQRPNVPHQVVIGMAEWAAVPKFTKLLTNIPAAALAWAGTTQDLADLYMLLIDEDRPTEAHNMQGFMGWDSHREVYVMNNGLLDRAGNFHPADENGLVHHNGLTYYFPCVSNLNMGDRLSAPEVKFTFRQGRIGWGKWLNVYQRAHGTNAVTGVAFTFASLFRDVVVRETGGRFPYWFLLGEPGAGKGRTIEPLSGLFGELEIINLQNNPTEPSTRKHWGYYHNALAVFNEMNPSSVSDWVVDAFKSPYDGQLRPKMDAKTGFSEIDYGQVNSTGLLMGQEENIFHQTAVAMRACFSIVSKDHHSSDSYEAMNQLTDLAKEGFGHLLSQMLSFRDVIEEQFATARIKYEQQLQARLKDLRDIDRRIIENWSIIITPLLIAAHHGLMLTMTEAGVLQLAEDNIRYQNRHMASSGVMDIFFNQFVRSYYRSPKYGITDNHVFQLPPDAHPKQFPGDKYPRGVVAVQLGTVYTLFQEFLKRHYPTIENVQLRDLQRRCEHHPAFIDKHPACWVGYKRVTTNGAADMILFDDGGQPVKKTTSAYVFDNALLKLELEFNVNLTAREQ